MYKTDEEVYDRILELLSDMGMEDGGVADMIYKRGYEKIRDAIKMSQHVKIDISGTGYETRRSQVMKDAIIKDLEEEKYERIDQIITNYFPEAAAVAAYERNSLNLFFELQIWCKCISITSDAHRMFIDDYTYKLYPDNIIKKRDDEYKAFFTYLASTSVHLRVMLHLTIELIELLRRPDINEKLDTFKDSSTEDVQAFNYVGQGFWPVYKDNLPEDMEWVKEFDDLTAKIYSSMEAIFSDLNDVPINDILDHYNDFIVTYYATRLHDSDTKEAPTPPATMRTFIGAMRELFSNLSAVVIAIQYQYCDRVSQEPKEKMIDLFLSGKASISGGLLLQTAKEFMKIMTKYEKLENAKTGGN